MVGKQVKHNITGEIKTIAEYDSSGYVTFTDGTNGDIHCANIPSYQKGKEWRYLKEESVLVEKTIVEERAFNEANLKLLREGKVTIKIPDFTSSRFDKTDSFINTINPILEAAGLDRISTGSTWKYVYKYDMHTYHSTEVDYEDAVANIPSGRSKKHLLIEDFYLDEPVPVEVSVNYDIY